MLLAIHFCASELTGASKFLFRQSDPWRNHLQNVYEGWTWWYAAE